MNITEKIFADHAGLDKVVPGQVITASVDLVMGNDLSTSLSIDIFRSVGAKRLFNPDMVTIVMSHFVPAKDIITASLCKKIRQFVDEQKIKLYFEVGKGGIEHVVLPDEGIVRPGMIIVGGDSHSTTYGAFGALGIGIGSTDMVMGWLTGKLWFRVPESIKINFNGKLGKWVMGKDLILLALQKLTSEGGRYKSLEYGGTAMKSLPMSDRSTLSNMAAELGGKCGVIEPDETTLSYVKARANDRPFKVYKSDPDSKYEQVLDLDVNGLPPMVACPYSPDNVKPVSEVGKVKVDQVYIGSCTNGRIEDLRIAMKVLEGRKLAPNVRLIVNPASQQVYKQAIQEGLVEKFVDLGAVVSTPTCGACLGGHMGVVGPDEVCVSTTNRNYRGRMGHVDAKVYLVNPAVAAATAVAGYLCSPEEVC